MPVRDMPPLADLSLAELAAASGVDADTIQLWQVECGFPESIRDERGHPGYARDVVRQVVRVRDDLAAGVLLADAVAAVSHTSDAWRPQSPSIYAAVRESVGDVRTLTKRSILGIAWAIEDECLGRAHQAVVVGAFQEERYFRPPVTATPPWPGGRVRAW